MESFTNCTNKEDEELKKCLENIAYSNEDIVLKTNHRGYNQTSFSFGLYQAEAIDRDQLALNSTIRILLQNANMYT